MVHALHRRFRPLGAVFQFDGFLMLKIPAHTANGFVGWLRIPEKQHFAWTLRIEPSPRSVVMVQVRVQSQNRGWTHYHYADLTTLSAAQVDQLTYSGWLEPMAAEAAA